MSEPRRLWGAMRRAFEDGERREFTIVHQAGFALFLALAVGSLWVFRGQSAHWEWVLAGLTVLAVSTALAFIPDRGMRWHPNFVIPLLDFFALGLSRFGLLPDGAALSVVAFLPALWLASAYRMRGAVAATLLTVVTISIPTLLSPSTPNDLPQYVLITALPITVALVAGLTVGLIARLNENEAQLTRALHDQEALGRDAQWSAGLLGSVLNTIDVAVIVFDRDGHTVVENETSQRFTSAFMPVGASPRDEANFALYQLGGSSTLPLRDRPVARALRGESVTDMLLVAGRPQDEQVTLSVSTRPVRGNADLANHTVLVATDVTAIQRMMREREAFIATVSHELRTPLTSIVGYTDLAVDEVEAESVLATYLDVVRRNAEQLANLVEDLLLEQQARSGELRLSTTEFDLARLVEHTVESVQPAARDRGTSVVADVERPVRIVGDQRRIAQVLDNLITNGIKYGGDGGVTVSLHSDDDLAIIRVADSGPGLEKTDVDRLFTPFFRTEDVRATATRGAGLGLTVTKSIVTAHGGSIAVESIVGDGATFVVTLPGRVDPLSTAEAPDE